MKSDLSRSLCMELGRGVSYQKHHATNVPWTIVGLRKISRTDRKWLDERKRGEMRKDRSSGASAGGFFSADEKRTRRGSARNCRIRRACWAKGRKTSNGRKRVCSKRI